MKVGDTLYLKDRICINAARMPWRKPKYKYLKAILTIDAFIGRHCLVITNNINDEVNLIHRNSWRKLVKNDGRNWNDDDSAI